MDTDELKRNLNDVRERIEKASVRAGSKVTLVAATKTVPADIVAEIVALGVKDVGENRVQEYLDKRDAVQGALWHFIGTLQRNKAKYLVGNVCLIQSVSSRELADEISRLAVKRGVVQPVLAELNAGDEASKTGAGTGEIDGLIDYISSLDGLCLRGLMAVPPRDAPEQTYKDVYKVYQRHCGGQFDILSVGMSGDYERAIANGSNMVRVGTSLFGGRKY